jgi:CubicO group peptidase (beta-lactamase class C family)
MTTVSGIHAEADPALQRHLEELAREHDVPGAVVAVLLEDEVTEAATGVLNRNTGVPVTTDALFRIGSVTKMYTATLAMCLVHDGKLDLDAPVKVYLPKFRVADPQATEAITVRMILCHTSGLDGDLPADTGRGDDCLDVFLNRVAPELPQVTSPGGLFSYSNPAFTILGSVVERVTGQTWDAALRERLLTPLGAAATMTLPEEAILRRAAVGHLTPGGHRIHGAKLVPTDVWGWPRSCGPAGGIITTAADMIAFARLHLDGGRAPDGTLVMSSDQVRLMQEPQVDVPNKLFAAASGLGWRLRAWDGRTVLWHGGNGLAQMAELHVLPHARCAVALVGNSYTSIYLFRDLLAQLLADRLGITVPPPPEPDDTLELELSRYAGTYRANHLHLRFEQHDGRLAFSLYSREEGGDLLGGPAPNTPARPIDATRFLLGNELIGEFRDFDPSGRPRVFHTDCVMRRVD